LTGATKHFLTDPALAVRLLSLTKAKLISGGDGSQPLAFQDGALLGRLFESLVALSVRTFSQAIPADTYHLRTESGRHEVDFIVETDAGVLGVEVKLGEIPSDHDVRHLNWLKQKLGDKLLDLVVVTTGSEAFRRPDGIAVVPLALLGP
jgi:hypothetical protein